MIKDIVESRIKNEYPNIINEIDGYMGYRYSSVIQETSKKINFIISNEYFDEVNNEKIFLGKEPICVKNKDNIDIVVPFSCFCESNGNVVFVHLLLHALLEDKINNSEIFNETVVDYMSQEISRILEEKGINVTVCDEPSYSSSSFYSLMFSEIENFYEINKNNFIDNFMGKDIEFKGEIDDIIYAIESKAKNILLERNIKERDNIQRR